ncbi:hypothetical protein ACDA63_13375 [Uliginosibacterium sp. sgz301328]|uniref:hypothetical protein n=1 Tax=Uliginosibacterium sp. sgz301328 TaxID=3243764 RepID=UPI00359D1F02
MALEEVEELADEVDDDVLELLDELELERELDEDETELDDELELLSSSLPHAASDSARADATSTERCFFCNIMNLPP